VKTTLLLFTGSYPYAVAAENTFLPQELRELARHFDRVVLVPAATAGERMPIDAPNVEVRTDYAASLVSARRRVIQMLRGIVDPLFLRECVSRTSQLRRRPSAVLRIAAYYVKARLTERWIGRYYRRQRDSNDASVLYTWWFDGTTFGLSLYAGSRGLAVISRGHNYDIYESRFDPPFIPFRSIALARLTLLFADSQAGARHVADTYKEHADRVRTGLLGVDDPGFLCKASADGVVRVLSCSKLAPVKRIDLIIRSIAAAGRRWPETRFRWVHVGLPETRELPDLAATILPSNVEHEFREYRGNADLMKYYRSNPVDVFVNLSSFEGTPVAIMEAISVGMPVIATAVGGNVEIVGPENGILVPSNANSEDVATAIGAFLVPSPTTVSKRRASRARWERDYNAARNYGEFAAQLARLAARRQSSGTNGDQNPR
jgi:glycosyltransferase involved in cell wall biosynthesis